MAKGKAKEPKSTNPRKVDPKVERDLGPGHVTRPDSAPRPKRSESDADKEED